MKQFSRHMLLRENLSCERFLFNLEDFQLAFEWNLKTKELDYIFFSVAQIAEKGMYLQYSWALRVVFSAAIELFLEVYSIRRITTVLGDFSKNILGAQQYLFSRCNSHKQVASYHIMYSTRQTPLEFGAFENYLRDVFPTNNDLDEQSAVTVFFWSWSEQKRFS